MVEKLNLTKKPYKTDEPLDTNFGIEPLEEMYAALKLRKNVPPLLASSYNSNSGSIVFGLTLTVSNIAVSFPHTNDPGIPHLPSAVEYLRLRTLNSNYKYEVVKMSRFDFELEKDMETGQEDVRLHMNDSTVSSRAGAYDSDEDYVYVEVSWLALEQFTQFKHLNIFIDDCTIRWSPDHQLTVLRVSRDVTCSVWTMLTGIRAALQSNQPNSFPGTKPYDDVNAFEDAASKVLGLVAGDGNVLKRLMFTNFMVFFTFNDGDDEPFRASFSHLISNEIPEHFQLRNVVATLVDQDVLSVSDFSLRHCLDRNDAVSSGRKLLDVRTRNWFCQNYPSATAATIPSSVQAMLGKKDGFNISVSGIQVVLPHNIPNFGNVLKPMLVSVAATVKSFLDQEGSWTPEDDPDFRRVFWRPPPLPHDASYGPLLESRKCDVSETAPTPAIWASIRDVTLCVVDDPLEGWLELIRPFQLSEMEARMGRDLWIARCGLEQLLGTNADLENGTSWINRVRSERDNLQALIGGGYRLGNVDDEVESSPPCLLKVCASIFQVDIDFPKKNEEAVKGIVGGFGGDMVSILERNLVFDTLTSLHVKLVAESTSVKFRGQKEDLLHLGKVYSSGKVAIVAPAAPKRFYDESTVKIDGQQVRLTVGCALPKVYLDIGVHCEGVQIKFRPASLYAMQEVAGVCAKLFPKGGHEVAKASSILGDWKWWDVGRILLASKYVATIESLEVSVLGSGNDSRCSDKEEEESIHLQVGFIAVKYGRKKCTIEGIEFAVKVSCLFVKDGCARFYSLLLNLSLFLCFCFLRISSFVCL